ncbi:general substrate transporter [Melanomma pulvis-pyrius CBS 109.77]|uniref:General substrate transporter n=1 Tax=Melanomma pulvis-pyrius CBS 109.77 TaxID=1314802 RepID=A0A6A6XNM6_9PLEO|nr:general substrate transporter [Melanomma pulvis-pyrius CBS 109.77]
MTLRQGIRTYPKAILWSMAISTCLIMEGFDTILLANLFAYAPFKRKFGIPSPHHPFSYELTATWQTFLSNGALVGEIIGLFIAGVVAERIGYRWTLIAALGAVTGFVGIVVSAESVSVLLVGEVLLGVPWGVFQTLSTSYAVEVCPVALRGYLTTYVNACWVFGQLLASIVLRAMLTRDDKWGYKIPFALQWIWPLPIALLVYFAPESPWWLVRQNLLTEARHTLIRLRSRVNNQTEGSVGESDYEGYIEGTLDMMKRTNDREIEVNGGTKYSDCFKGTDKRRTEIACMCWIIQTLCGSTFMGYSTYFYEQAGIGSTHAFTFSMIQFTLGLVGVIISWVLMSSCGRRTLYLAGQTTMFFLLLLIGILACIPHRIFTFSSNAAPTPVQISIVALLLLFTLTYDATVGPICYSLVSEIPSTRLRGKTIVLARNCYNISGIVTNITTPRMLNPTAWAWGAKSAFFWSVTAALGLSWSWWRLPEPKGRTFAELDELFERKVPARRFKGSRVHIFAAREGEVTEKNEA